MYIQGETCGRNDHALHARQYLPACDFEDSGAPNQAPPI